MDNKGLMPSTLKNPHRSVHPSCSNARPAQDYFSLAKEYVLTAPYQNTASGEACVICGNRMASIVFFPCEHKCLCKHCVAAEGFDGRINNDYDGDDDERLCPICW